MYLFLKSTQEDSAEPQDSGPKLENSDHSSKSFSNRSIQSVINLAAKSENLEITEDDQEVGRV